MKETRFRLVLLASLPGTTTPTALLQSVPEYDIAKLQMTEWPNSCRIPISGVCASGEDVKAGMLRVIREMAGPQFADKVKDAFEPGQDRLLEINRTDDATAVTIDYCLVVPGQWFSSINPRGLRFIRIQRIADIKDRAGFDKMKGVTDGSIALEAAEAEALRRALVNTKHFIVA